MLARREGDGGEPTVLVHGIGSSHGIWDEMLGELGRGRDVLALDLPGFGDSPPLPKGERTLERTVDAIEAEMDAVGWERANLVGHSMGGWLVLELARRGRALRTIAIAPVGGAVVDEAKRSRSQISQDRRGARFARLMPDVVLKGVFGTAWSRRVLLRKQVTRGEDVKPERAVYATRTMGKAESFDELLDEISCDNDLIDRSRERFAGISSPVAIVWGTDDEILSPAGGPRLADAIPGAELHLMPGVGHAPHLDRPGELARLVSGLLDAG